MAATPAAFRKSRREVVMMPDYTFRFTIGSRQEPQRHRDTKVWRLNEKEQSKSSRQTFVSLCLCGSLLIVRTGPLGPADTRFSDGHKQAWLLRDRAECVAGSRSGADMARTYLRSRRPLR